MQFRKWGEATVAFGRNMPDVQYPNPILYLGISGVLHPSESIYRVLFGRDPWKDGHTKYESLGFLAGALAAYPALRIVLTSTVPWKYGLPQTLAWLGDIGDRVIAFTYEDLTTKVPATKSSKPMSDNDYWRLDKSSIVRSHVAWLKPPAWIVIDDEDILWDDDTRENRLVLTPGHCGLADLPTLDRLVEVMWKNFGRPTHEDMPPTF